jgi:NitT/TauT family transport system substrate-binding protein
MANTEGGSIMSRVKDRDSAGFDRRNFLASMSASSAAWLLGLPSPVAAEPPPEIRKVRLIHAPSMCLAPQYLARELLLAEGFAEVEYVPFEAPTGTYTPLWLPGIIAEGRADFSMGGVVWYPPAIDSGAPLLVLAGIHVGCYELFANSGVNSIRDLRGKTVVATRYGDDYLFISTVLSYVGIDPRKDVNWRTTTTTTEGMQLFVEGKVDAFVGFPPEPQQLRAKKIGRVILNTSIDRPWSQYLCCLLSGNREFVRKYPAATKKVVRAYLKAADICANEPNRAARYMVDKGYVEDFKYALALITDLPYNRWREADPEDTLRFHALRLYEVGTIKSTPQRIIAQGTDWRFLNELKRELRA